MIDYAGDEGLILAFAVLRIEDAVLMLTQSNATETVVGRAAGVAVHEVVCCPAGCAEDVVVIVYSVIYRLVDQLDVAPGSVAVHDIARIAPYVH